MKALRKDFWMEIRKSRARFISIFFIVALGVAFFSGIQASSPDMRLSGDAYYDTFVLMDLKIMGTMGLTEKDVQALAEMDGVEIAEGAWGTDVLCQEESAQTVIHVESVNESMNQLKASDGELPKKSGEIFLDSAYAEKYGYKVGDTISLIQDQDSELLLRQDFTVTGIGSSPLYISFNRGNTTLGSGEINGFAYVLPEDFDQEIYTQIYVRAHGAEDLISYTDAYDSLIERMEEKIEGIQEERCQIRYDDVVAEAQKELEDGEKELEDARKEAEEELADARKELEDAEKELADAEKEYKDGVKQLNDARKELREGKTKLEDAGKELEDGKAQLADAKAQLEDGWAQYQDGWAQLEDGQAQLDEAQSKLQAGWDQLRPKEQELENGWAQYQSGQAQLNEAKASLEDGRKQLQQGLDAIAQGKQEIADGKQTIAGTREDLSAKQEECQQGLEQVIQLQESLNGTWEELETGRQQAQDVVSELQAQMAVLQETLEQLQAQEPPDEEEIQNIQGQIAALQESIEQAQGTLDGIVGQMTEVEAQQEALAGQRSSLEGSRASLEAGMNELNEQETGLEKKEQQLLQQEKTLQQEEENLTGKEQEYQKALRESEKARAQLEAGQAEIEKARQELNAAQEQLNAKQNELNAGWGELAQSRVSLEEGARQIAQNEQTILDGEEEIRQGKEELADGEKEIEENEKKLKDARKELEDGKKELEDGKKEYEDGKKEAEEKISDGEKELEDAREEISSLEMPEWIVSNRNALPEYSDFGDNADRMRSLGQAFPVIFFLVAALISLTTMTRMVEEQRTQIGTMKALGYGKGAIAGKYLFYALLATVGGSVLGILIGEKVLPYIIITSYGIMYHNIPSCIQIDYELKFALIASGASVVCTLGATIFSCYKALAETPASLMRPPAPKEGKRVLIERVGFIWKHLSFSWKSTLRNLFRYKKRLFMTIFGIAGSMGLLLVGFGLRDSIMDVSDRQYEELQHYDGIIIADEDATVQEKEALAGYLEKENRLERFTHVQMTKMTVPRDKSSISAYVYVPQNLDNFHEDITLRNRISKEPYQLTDEGAVISEKTASLTGCGVGDMLTLEWDNHSYQVRIAAVTENYMSHYVYMTPTVYRETFGKEPDYASTVFTLKEEFKENPEELGNEILKYPAALSISYTSSLSEQLERMLSTLGLVVVVLIISAGMLAFVVLYNLNNINITERKRELATLKVLGFYDGEVSGYVFRENIILTLVGVLAGALFGILLHRFVITTVEVDAVMFGRNIKTISFIYSALITCSFSVIVNLVMHFKLKKIDMIESLKSVE